MMIGFPKIFSVVQVYYMERTYAQSFLKYAALAAISYLVVFNTAGTLLDRNHVMLISFGITIVFAILDLYSPMFSGVLTALCNCPKIASNS